MSFTPPSLDFQALFEALPGFYLVLLPDAPRYTIVAMNDACARATMTEREEILGRGLFELFPEDATEPGTGRLRESLERALSQHARAEPDKERWRSPSNVPVFGPGGEVAYIIHAVEDVTVMRHLQEQHRLLARTERAQSFAATERERLLTLAQSLFDHASDSILIADIDGRITDVNVVACEMLGYSRHELIGKTIVDIIPFEDAPRTGTVQVAEWTHVRKDGTSIPVEVSTKILPDGRRQAFVRDISVRKRIEKELRDAHSFLDAIIENIPLMLFIKESTSLRFVRFNRAGESLLGWSREMLVGKSDFDFWPREQAEFFVDKDRETLKAGKVVDIGEEPIQTRHHGVRTLHTKKVPILDASGTPLYLLGISEDITERKQLEEEQRLLSEAAMTLSASLDYDQTLATLTQLVVRRVADWCAVDVMEERGKLRRLKVASADPADAALCAVLEQMPPDRDLPHLSRLVFENRSSLVVEHVTPEFMKSVTQGPEHLAALRATHVTSLIAVPLSLRGESVGVLLLGSSNDRRVYGPGDLRWAEALALRAAVAIENARLYQESIQASQLRDQVLGVVAHDLRNPLSTILAQEAALHKRPGLERELGIIHRAATRMNGLIQDLLDVRRIEAGELQLRTARLAANDLVVDGVELHQALAAPSVELRVEVGTDNPEVWGDRDRLLQVFDNLIGNAIKFTARGGHITVGTALHHHDVVFWVADDGCGIAQDALPHVFDRFWQATAGDRRGAGLGLPIVKGIVEAHGGHVWVESTLGRGSTFFFSIPTADPAAERPAPVIH